MQAKNLILPIALALAVAACADPTPSPATTTAVAATSEGPTTTSSTAPAVTIPPTTADFTVGTASGPASGNRAVVGSLDITSSQPVDIELSRAPVWIVAVPGSTDPEFVVALEDGTLEAWRVGAGGAESLPLNIDRLAPGTPPLVISSEGGLAVVTPPEDASPLTYPAIVDDQLVYVNIEGNLVIDTAGAQQTLALGALPDSRISVNKDGLVSVLAEPTDRYPHGVLGDVLEAGRIVVVDPSTGTVVAEAVIDEPSVVEGIAAPWVDADGDGTEELLVTVSNSAVGARLVLFDRNGDLVAEGPAIGQSNRWRNQLGAAATGPNGEIEIIDVRVPHIGGVVEFFRLDGSELVIQTRQSGYTSHAIGSRNLDLAVAADVTGNGRVEVLVPTQARDRLGVLARSNDGVEVVTELELSARLITNIAAAELADDRLAIAVGTSDSVLRVWR